MRKLVDSSDRNPLDFFHFAGVFVGCLVIAAGIVMTSPGMTVFGAVIFGFGIAYFIVYN